MRINTMVGVLLNPNDNPSEMFVLWPFPLVSLTKIVWRLSGRDQWSVTITLI